MEVPAVRCVIARATVLTDTAPHTMDSWMHHIFTYDWNSMAPGTGYSAQVVTMPEIRSCCGSAHDTNLAFSITDTYHGGVSCKPMHMIASEHLSIH